MVSSLFCLNTNSAHAQTSYVNLLYAGDSSFVTHCSLPDTIEMDFYGNYGGYLITDSMHMDISFGDGTDSSFNIAVANGANTYFYGIANHIYTLPGDYTVQYIVTAPDGKSDTLVDPSVLVAASCSDISGKLFMDANANCIYNVGETTIQNYVTASYNGQIVAYGYSDSLGDYTLTVPSGFSYIVSLPYFNSLNVACPVTAQYLINTFPATGNDFGITCNSQADLSVAMHGNGFRPNSATSVWLTAFNKIISCVAPTSTITITLDPKLSYLSSSQVPLSVSSTQVVFNAGQLDGLSPYEFTSSLTLLTDISANIGDTLCITIAIDPVIGDVNPADNTIVLCLPVRNSCDPNEKYEVHAGAGTGNITVGSELDYTIMFQNLGNDDAYDINVTDELDPNLDLSTLKITGFSFPPAIFLVGNTMKFQFNNIHLPAAAINEPKSHGFVSYKIKPKTGLALGTTINNFANIYFDFNAPIVTNTVTDILAQTVGFNSLDKNNLIKIYPNPANDYFTIATGTNMASTLTVSDVTGRILIRDQEIADNQKINIKDLNAGIYFLTLVSKGVTYSGKLTIK